ncbi:acyl carrier protein [Amycolatopsis jejuensis]|uniref:acyl carrier protein n=1 Tax=Amycolatopsis jejuensis TaxID=330084 RepID=UPI000526558B|nr:acyl carrier protein [Amycolatopsis jejuensis]
MPVNLETEIREFVLTTLAKDMNHPVPEGSAGDDSPMGAGGIDLDSLSLIELTIRLEQRFGVEFPETSIEPFGAMTLQELVADLVQRGASA